MGSKVVPRVALEACKRVPLAPIGHRKVIKCLSDLLENIVSNFKRLLDFIRNSCQTIPRGRLICQGVCLAKRA